MTWQQTLTAGCIPTSDTSIIEQISELLRLFMVEFVGEGRGKVLDVFTGFDPSVSSGDLPVIVCLPGSGEVGNYQERYEYNLMVYHSLWDGGSRFEHLQGAVNFRSELCRFIYSSELPFVDYEDGVRFQEIRKEELSGTEYNFCIVTFDVTETVNRNIVSIERTPLS